MNINVLEYFESGALRRCPEKVAVVDGDREYTFTELEHRAKQCARHIIDRLDAVCEPIAVLLPKCAGAVVADLGIAYSGNIYTNLDVKSPLQRLRNILDHINPVLVVTSRELVTTARDLGVDASKVVFVEDACGESVGYDSRALWQRLDRVIDTDPLCIINTSGSTGTPKGVALSHRGTIDFMDWAFGRFPFDGEERIGSLSPFFFDIFTVELNLCLAKGATLVLIPDRLAAFPAQLLEFMRVQQVSWIFWVPTIMVHISNLGLLDEVPLPRLRTVWFAGEVFPMKHLNRWRRAWPSARFVNLYGPIEISVDCTYFVVDRAFADDEVLPIGVPCRNTDVLILNGQNRACGVGEHGELCVRGSSLALGYWNDAEKTARAFVPNPLNTRYPELIYRTGDIVYRSATGEIMLVGRKDFQIKHLGYRIELPEIEHQVLAIPGIANACVLYRKARKEITLFYETDGTEIGPADIRRALAETLPKYMWPTSFHQLPELPRNPNGKIDRNALTSRLEEQPE